MQGNGVQLELTEAAIHSIADKGFDPQFGARPVKRAIQKYVLNDLSKQLIAGTVHSDHTIVVDFDENGLVFKEKEFKNLLFRIIKGMPNGTPFLTEQFILIVLFLNQFHLSCPFSCFYFYNIQTTEQI